MTEHRGLDHKGVMRECVQDWHFCDCRDEVVPISVSLGTYVTPDHLCPDLLRYEQIGAADGLRGHVVRGFFRVMQMWPPK